LVQAFELLCEASNEAIGAILGQRDGDNFNIIPQASRTLNEAQRNYPMVKRTCCCCFLM
jgi:hypothetical protein